jgi:hypothetical protein
MSSLSAQVPSEHLYGPAARIAVSPFAMIELPVLVPLYTPLLTLSNSPFISPTFTSANDLPLTTTKQAQKIRLDIIKHFRKVGIRDFACLHLIREEHFLEEFIIMILALLALDLPVGSILDPIFRRAQPPTLTIREANNPIAQRR